jgi:predicted nucleotidyltransferase component of viral defense system
MIPLRYIEEWREQAAWATYAQTEQDLIIARALIDMFSDELLNSSLAFRGGTALHKIYLSPQIRYSEDIDLVQIRSEPINPVLKRIREKLSFLGTKRTVKQHIHNNTIVYHFVTETMPVIDMRLKIEINTREHFNVLGLKTIPFKIENGWFSGECNLTCYELEELLGTKLRALYQRRKGRDLFDLYYALKTASVDAEKVMKCYRKYISFSTDNPPTQKQFLANMEEKMLLKEFTDDIYSIVKKGVTYDNQSAYELIRKELIERL